MPRLAWVDHLKAFGITIVVIAHPLLPLPRPVESWVHSFTMPLFFVLSGFLLPPEDHERPFTEFFQRRLVRHIRLYFIFGLLGVVQLAVMSQAGVERDPLGSVLLTRLGSVLYGSASFPTGSPYLLHPIPLWFFPAFIVALAIDHGVVGRLPAVGQVAMVAGLFWLGIAWRRMILPWEFETALTAAPFVFAGRMLRRSPRVQAAIPGVPIVFAPLLLALGWMISVFNIRTDFRTSEFGNVGIYFAACIPTLAGLAILSSRLPRSEWVVRISEATIFIFPAHLFVFWAVDTVSRGVVHLSAAQMGTYYYAIAESLLTLALLAASYRFIRQRLPVF